MSLFLIVNTLIWIYLQIWFWTGFIFFFFIFRRAILLGLTYKCRRNILSLRRNIRSLILCLLFLWLVWSINSWILKERRNLISFLFRYIFLFFNIFFSFCLLERCNIILCCWIFFLLFSDKGVNIERLICSWTIFFILPFNFFFITWILRILICLFIHNTKLFWLWGYFELILIKNRRLGLSWRNNTWFFTYLVDWSICFRLIWLACFNFLR